MDRVYGGAVKYNYGQRKSLVQWYEQGSEQGGDGGGEGGEKKIKDRKPKQNPQTQPPTVVGKLELYWRSRGFFFFNI